MDLLHNSHFFPLSSQGNIYTLNCLHLANGTNKLLVASLRREVICFEYQENSAGVLVPTAKEISFTYLPGGAEIISITAFNKSETNNDFVIGITIIKNSNDLHALETYLNIYSGWEPSLEFNMESISQNCVNNIELKFIPYHLTYTYLIFWKGDRIDNKEVVFLLSGSDHKIHIYQENKINHLYKEIDYVDIFPEFYKPPSIVIWVDIFYYNDYEERITAFGCECGYVRLCRINVQTNQIMFNFSTRFDNTISCVKIYTNTYNIKCPEFIKQNYKKDIVTKKNPTLNLVVTNTILPAVFFADILHYGLKKYVTLPRYELTSVLSTVEIADVDFDGCDEILIGNSNREIVAYKYNDHIKNWDIMALKKFPTPVLDLKYVDITGDGIKELIVLTIKGVHILQHDLSFIQNALEKKVKALTSANINTLSSSTV